VVVSARRSAPPASGVEAVIRQRVAERADEWFPGVGPRPAVALRRLGERPRAVLYTVEVGDGPQHRVLAKVRRGWSGGVQRAGARPRLAPHLLPASEQTALEFSGLTAIHTMFGTGDADFGAVRPLDHLPAEDAILMEYVDAPTLRDVWVRSSRLAPQRRRRHTSHRAEEAWWRSGAWLRVFQQHMPDGGLPARQASREEVVDRFEAFGSFLTHRLGARAAGDDARSGARLAAAILPPRLPLAVGHGDYAPRNVFLLGDGRLAVFDPLSRWRVPRYEDLCRFLVAIRLQGLQVHSHGAAYGARKLDLVERAVLEGYGGSVGLRLPELRCYQLLITLDKWSALVDSPSRSPLGRLRNASLERAAGHLRKELRRLVQLTEAGEG
jgi:hypothetical protein